MSVQVQSNKVVLKGKGVREYKLSPSVSEAVKRVGEKQAKAAPFALLLLETLKDEHFKQHEGSHNNCDTCWVIAAAEGK